MAQSQKLIYGSAMASWQAVCLTNVCRMQIFIYLLMRLIANEMSYIIPLLLLLSSDTAYQAQGCA